MNLRWTSREPLVGLDLGRHAVRAVWLSSAAGGVPRVARRETLRLPLDGMGAREATESWIEQTGLREASCSIALAGSQALFQPLLLPPDDPRTDAQAADVEVLKYSEMMSDTMRHAHAPFALKAGERRLLLALARATAVEETVARAAALKLRVVEVTPGPVALYNALCAAAGSAPALFAGVGAGGTDIAIGSASGLYFVRSFGVGGRAFTDALARALKIPFAQAESRKETDGQLRGDGPDAAALRAVADQWLNELRACLSVYANLFPEPEARPQRVVLAGGGARLAGFAERISEALQLPVVGAEAAGWSDDPAEAAACATAVGLALAAHGTARCRISLLPDDLRYEREFRRQKPLWGAAAVVAGLIFAVGLIGGYRDNQRKANVLRAQEASIQARQQLAASIETSRRRNEQLRRMGGEIRALLESGPLVRELLAAIQQAKDPDDWITLVADAESYFEKSSAPPPERRAAPGPGESGEAPPPPAPPPFNRVLIEGYTRRGNLATVKRLIDGLSAAPFVAAADLLSDDAVVPDEAAEREGLIGARRFVLDVRLRDR